jgi:rhodanese-related sulfurtransferase
MDVPAGVWIAAAIIGILLTWMTIAITNKAYSKKWDREGDVENPVPEMEPSALLEKLEGGKVRVIDVRGDSSTSTYQPDHENLVLLQIDKKKLLNRDADEIQKVREYAQKEPIIIACSTGNSSKNCVLTLREFGIDAISLKGGMTAWENEKKATE